MTYKLYFSFKNLILNLHTLNLTSWLELMYYQNYYWEQQIGYPQTLLTWKIAFSLSFDKLFLQNFYLKYFPHPAPESLTPLLDHF